MTFRSTCFKNIRIRKLECDAQIEACEADNITAEGGKLTLRVERSRFRQLRFSDCDLSIRGSIDLDSISFSNTRATFDLDNSEIKSGTFYRVAITGQLGRTVIADSVWRSSNLKIIGSITLSGCEFKERTEVCIQSERTGNLDLRESRFVEATLRFFA